LICFGVIADFIPPPSPHWSAAHVASFFDAHRTGIRIGMLGGLIASTLFFPFFTVVSAEIARIEGRPPLLAVMQFGGAVLLLVFFAICNMLWIAASFRPELGASTVRALNDLSWLMFVMVFPAYVMQMLCVAVASFRDASPDPLWPRWAGYFCLWTGVAGMGGGLAVFFKHGPFAWNGLIGFYVPFAVFVAWLGVMTYLMHTRFRREATEPAAALEPSAPGGPPAPAPEREPALA
jgi:hypothetical protein